MTETTNSLAPEARVNTALTTVTMPTATTSAAISQSNPTDAQFANQWHLLQTQPNLLDLNVVRVWEDYTGRGINTWVLDDGFDYLHSDLAPNYNTALDIDYEGVTVDNNAYPTFTADNHGTACMGIIGAARNGTGAVGIAYETQLVGIRGYSDDQASQGSLDAYVTAIGAGARYAAQNGADVISMSNGYSNHFDSGVTTAAQTLADWEWAAANGRGGLGLNIVKSAANAREQYDDINQKSVDASVYSISVAAVKQDGFVDSYSSYGSALLVSGFGTPGEVVTTDRSGAPGYGTGDFTSTFNGTSSAAPMVAGVVTLMLDANAGLGWRDVQTILSATARHVGTAIGVTPAQGTTNEFFTWGVNGAETWNGGGMHFSNDYGFGLVDGLAAVRLAETWLFTNTAARSQNLVTVAQDLTNTARPIPDGVAGANGFEGLLIAGVETENVNIEYTTVTISMSPSHTLARELDILVSSPDGTISSIKASNPSTDQTDFPGTWTFTTFAFKGETSAGQWQVYFQDQLQGDTGIVTDVVVRNHGSTGVNDTYVFTNEYSKVLSTDRTQINDANGGVDTFNASAVTVASRINLNAGFASIIDEVVLTTDGSIENAIGGDGEDMLTGNAAANKLWGMRGDDVLSGADGNDILVGERGNDQMSGGAGKDTLDGGVGVDSADYREKTAAISLALNGATYATVSVGGVAEDSIRNIEQVFSGSGSDRIYGDAFNNFVNGYAGNDVIRGGGGRDTLYGGVGVDTLDYSDKTTAVQVTLNGATNATVFVGGVAEDTVREFEVVWGGSAADTLTGDNFANLFRGGAGADAINGGGGVDAVDFRDQTGAVVLALNGATNATATIGGVAQDVVRNIETVYGGSGNDVLRGDNFNNELWGGVGRDTLRGMGGADRLVGGTQADVFQFNAISESTAAIAGRDTIVDFNRAEGDKIYLNLIDANTNLAGDQAFVLGALQSGQAGRLAVTGSASNWLVQGDVNGDGLADFAVLVTSVLAPNQATDFML